MKPIPCDDPACRCQLGHPGYCDVCGGYGTVEDEDPDSPTFGNDVECLDCPPPLTRLAGDVDGAVVEFSIDPRCPLHGAIIDMIRRGVAFDLRNAPGQLSLAPLAARRVHVLRDVKLEYVSLDLYPGPLSGPLQVRQPGQVPPGHPDAGKDTGWGEHPRTCDCGECP